MRFLPIGLDVRGRRCLVAGGGEVGTRKARNLCRAGAATCVVAPEATPEVVGMVEAGAVEWVREHFRPEHLDGVFLAVAATDDLRSNALLVEEARTRGILVCDASSGERSGVIFGALHQGDGFTVAVFTDGRNPSLARTTRDRIAAALTPGEDPTEPC